jgi:hypothetical protein
LENSIKFLDMTICLITSNRDRISVNVVFSNTILLLHTLYCTWNTNLLLHTLYCTWNTNLLLHALYCTRNTKSSVTHFLLYLEYKSSVTHYVLYLEYKYSITHIVLYLDYVSPLVCSRPQFDAIYSYFDLNSSFELVPHTPLLNILSAWGLFGGYVIWFHIHVSSRYSVVRFHSIYLVFFEVLYDVTQGSAPLAPLFYRINQWPLQFYSTREIFLIFWLC